MLTSAQLATLKTDINAQAPLAAARTAADWPTVAAFYNANTSPAVAVWKPSITVHEMNAVITWSAFAGLTALAQNAYMAMTQDGFVDATSATVRAGFSTVFGAGSASLTALNALAQRTATRLEALLVSVAGPPIVSAVFGQSLSADDVQKAMV